MQRLYFSIVNFWPGLLGRLRRIKTHGEEINQMYFLPHEQFDSKLGLLTKRLSW